MTVVSVSVSWIFMQGWNKTWDETVPEERLLKMTPLNLKMQKDLQVTVKPERGEADVVTKQKKAVELQPPSKRVVGKSTEPQANKGTKRPLEESDCKMKEVRLNVQRLKKSRSNSECSSVSGLSSKSSEEDVTSRLKRRSRRTRTTVLVKTEPEEEKREVKKVTAKKKKVSSGKAKATALVVIEESVGGVASGGGGVEFGKELELELPEALRDLLVDDYDLISRQRKTLMIPARLCVADFLESFLEEERKTAGGRGSRREVAGRLAEVEEVCRGLVQYLDASLGSALLYKFERVQYSDTVKLFPGVALSKLYPPIHLMRLLTRLPGLLGAALRGVLPVLQALVGGRALRRYLASC